MERRRFHADISYTNTEDESMSYTRRPFTAAIPSLCVACMRGIKKPFPEDCNSRMALLLGVVVPIPICALQNRADKNNIEKRENFSMMKV